MHARESAAAQASAGKAHKCPYLAGQAAKAVVAGGKAPASAEQVKSVEYGCRMHPEVTSKEKGRCPKCGMFLEAVR